MSFENSQKKVTKLEQIPDYSIILNDFGKVDYGDSYTITISTNIYSVDKITLDLFKTPRWIELLSNLKDYIANFFIEKKSDENAVKLLFSVGSKLTFFSVVDRNQKEIVMGENYKRLSFRISVMAEQNVLNTNIYLSTIFHYNNLLGRLYLSLLKPFHRFYIKKRLKDYANEI